MILVLHSIKATLSVLVVGFDIASAMSLAMDSDSSDSLSIKHDLIADNAHSSEQKYLPDIGPSVD